MKVLKALGVGVLLLAGAFVLLVFTVGRRESQVDPVERARRACVEQYGYGPATGECYQQLLGEMALRQEAEKMDAARRAAR